MSALFDQGCPRCESFHYQTEEGRKPNTLCELCRRDKAKEAEAARRFRAIGVLGEEFAQAMAQAFQKGGIDP